MSFIIDKNIEGLIFDLDGTLADTMPYHMRAWEYSSKIHGISFTREFLQKHTGSPAWKIAEILFKEQGIENGVSVELFLKTKTEWFFQNQHKVKAIKPVADIVLQYHKLLPMAIGTGGHNKAVHRTLEVIGMKDYFNIVVTANDVTRHKPDPETFLKCAKEMKIEPSGIMVFEDGDLGIEAAVSAGMTPVDVRGWYNSAW